MSRYIVYVPARIVLAVPVQANNPTEALRQGQDAARRLEEGDLCADNGLACAYSSLEPQETPDDQWPAFVERADPDRPKQGDGIRRATSGKDEA